jgi:putative transposase
MSQPLVKNYTHIVFSTKNRRPLIHPPLENELHKYLGGICANLEFQPICVGGHVDHVHIICMLSKKIGVMKLIQEVKTSSSKWMKEKDSRLSDFYWQGSYASISVDEHRIDALKIYVQNQQEHHKVKTFQEEYRGFLREANIDFDERYMWD